MQTALNATILFGLINALRQQFPKLDGWAIWVISFACGLGFAFLTAPDLHAYRTVVLEGLGVGAGALGVSGAVVGASNVAMKAYAKHVKGVDSELDNVGNGVPRNDNAKLAQKLSA